MHNYIKMLIITLNVMYIISKMEMVQSPCYPYTESNEVSLKIDQSSS